MDYVNSLPAYGGVPRPFSFLQVDPVLTDAISCDDGKLFPLIYCHSFFIINNWLLNLLKFVSLKKDNFILSLILMFTRHAHCYIAQRFIFCLLFVYIRKRCLLLAWNVIIGTIEFKFLYFIYFTVLLLAYPCHAQFWRQLFEETLTIIEHKCLCPQWFCKTFSSEGEAERQQAFA